MRDARRRLFLSCGVLAVASIGLTGTGGASEAARQKKPSQATTNKRTAPIEAYKLVGPDALKRQLLGGTFGTRLSQKASLIMAIYGDAYAYYGDKKYDDLLQLLDISEKMFRDLESAGALWNPERFQSKDDMKGFQSLFAESFRLRAKTLLRLGREDDGLKYWNMAEEIERVRTR